MWKSIEPLCGLHFRSDEQVASETVRELFGDAFLLIRFSQLQVEEFDDGPRHSGYLTPDVCSFCLFVTFTSLSQEQEHILAWITSGQGPSEFASQPRLGYIAAKGDKNEVVSRPCWSFCEYCEERQDSGDRGRQHSCEGWRRLALSQQGCRVECRVEYVEHRP